MNRNTPENGGTQQPGIWTPASRDERGATIKQSLIAGPEHRLKLAASAIVAKWRTNGTLDRDELRRNLVAALAEVETPADKFRLLAQKFAEPMVHGGYTRTDTLTFTVNGLERFVAAVFEEEVR